MARIGRKSKGRQRIEMVKMANESNLQVTFSKRRAGLFKKANELVTLCGVQMAIIIFSPGRKVFCYGHPSVENIIERYINPCPPNPSNVEQLVEVQRRNTIEELNTEVTIVEQMLHYAKQYAGVIDMRWRNSPIKYLLETSIDDLNSEQRQSMAHAMEKLLKDVKEYKSMVQTRVDFGPFGANSMLSHNLRALRIGDPSMSQGFHITPTMLSGASSSTILPYNLIRASRVGSSDISAMLPRPLGVSSYNIAAMLPRPFGASSSSNLSHGLDIPTTVPQNLMAPGIDGPSMSHEFDITAMIPRPLRASSSNITTMLPRHFEVSISSNPLQGLDIPNVVPPNFMAFGTGSSSTSHGFNIPAMLPRASEVASSTISRGFDITPTIPQNLRAPGPSTSNISPGFDQGSGHENV